MPAQLRDGPVRALDDESRRQGSTVVGAVGAQRAHTRGRAGADIEAWLDTCMFEGHIPRDRWAMLMRAELARWHALPPAEEWRTRREQLLALPGEDEER